MFCHESINIIFLDLYVKLLVRLCEMENLLNKKAFKSRKLTDAFSMNMKFVFVWCMGNSYANFPFPSYSELQFVLQIFFAVFLTDFSKSLVEWVGEAFEHPKTSQKIFSQNLVSFDYKLELNQLWVIRIFKTNFSENQYLNWQTHSFKKQNKNHSNLCL